MLHSTGLDRWKSPRCYFVRAAIHRHSGTLAPLLRLVWPVLVEQLLVMMVGFADTLLAGHYLGPSHLAAMTVIAYALWLFTNMFAFVAIGGVAMTARFVGAGDWEGAKRVANQAYVLGAGLALVFALCGLAFGDRIAWALQLEGEPAALASRYLRILIPVIPLMMLEQVGIGCLRGAGDMVTGLVAMIVVNVVNVSVAWSLVSGAGPLPALGWDGLAIGTTCGHALGGLIPFTLLLRGRAGLRIERRLLKPDPPLMRRILRVGFPGGCDVMSLIALQLIFLSIVNRLPVDEVAAHGVAIRIESLAYLPGYAFQIAAATLAGQYLGAKDYRQAARSVLVACATSGTLLTGVGLVLFFGAVPLSHLFLGPEQAGVAAVTPSLLRIVSVAMPPLAIMQVLTGALRGAGDTAWPLVFTFLGFAGIRLPLAYVLAIAWHWGVAGAWYAMVADLMVRCALVIFRFTSGGWKRVEI
ncbi:MAG TPA: MATE family efflux transporter [Pirellulales bacterium]|nr:MATE family efflux transporter [Pirellulales bacterium]